VGAGLTITGSFLPVGVVKNKSKKKGLIGGSAFSQNYGHLGRIEKGKGQGENSDGGEKGQI